MAEFLIYTIDRCPFCVQAKNLLDNLGHTYVEKNVQHDEVLLAEMQARTSGAKTVPQIFLGETRIGGFTDLQKAKETGKLTILIEANS